jgi:hypothetical protein
VTVGIERPNCTDDVFFHRMVVAQLRNVLAKQRSLSVGRSLFLSASGAEPLAAQPLNDVGCTLSMAEVKLAESSAEEQTLWPLFHAGAAVAPATQGADRVWVLYNCAA